MINKAALVPNSIQSKHALSCASKPLWPCVAPSHSQENILTPQAVRWIEGCDEMLNSA